MNPDFLCSIASPKHWEPTLRFAIQGPMNTLYRLIKTTKMSCWYSGWFLLRWLLCFMRAKADVPCCFSPSLCRTKGPQKKNTKKWCCPDGSRHRKPCGRTLCLQRLLNVSLSVLKVSRKCLASVSMFGVKKKCLMGVIVRCTFYACEHSCKTTVSRKVSQTCLAEIKVSTKVYRK